MDVERLVPAEENARSEVSEWELQERSEWEEEKGGGRSWVPMVRNNLCFSPRPRSWHLRKRASGRVSISLVLSFVFLLVRFISS